MATAFTGTSDPARIMALLWRHQQPADTTGSPGRPGPKPGLSVDSIVVAAVAAADARGLAELSMRRLAAELGVGAMTLYGHVPGRGELVDLMYDSVLAALYPGGAAALGSGWRERLGAVADAHRQLYLAHPWAAHVAAGRPPLGPGLISCYEVELSAVAGVGLSDLEMDLAVSSVTGLVRALGAATAARDELARLTGVSEAQWWQASEPYFAKVFDAQRFPLAARVGAASGAELQAADDPDRTLDFALTALLDGLAARIDGGGGSPVGVDRGPQ